MLRLITVYNKFNDFSTIEGEPLGLAEVSKKNQKLHL